MVAKGANKKKSVAKPKDQNNKEPIIKEQILFFFKSYLNDDYKGYALRLYETLSRKKTIDISRGKKEIWAASIVYVIARLNFLFDSEHELHLSADTICDFFGTKKSTVGNKATTIEKACKLKYGAKGYCDPKIMNSFDFYRTPEGFIIPGFDKAMVDDDLDESEMLQVIQALAEKYSHFVIDDDEDDAPIGIEPIEMKDEKYFEMIVEGCIPIVWKTLCQFKPIKSNVLPSAIE